RLNEWLITGSGVLAALLHAAIVLSHPGPWSAARVVEFNIIIVFTCAIARFWPAMVGGGVIVAIHMFMLARVPDGTGVVPFNATLLTLTVTVFILYGNYRLEHAARMAFLLDAREKALTAELTE